MTSDLSQIGFLLFISALVAMLTRRLRLPYTVGLVLAGMGAYLANVRFELHLTKDLIFSIFLPPLVFEAALCIRWAEFKRDLQARTAARSSVGRLSCVCHSLTVVALSALTATWPAAARI
jgi:CPA1 family monovalent cation:H+ antiporter